MVCTIGELASAEYYLSCQRDDSPGAYYTGGNEPRGRWWNPTGLFGLKDGGEIDNRSFAALYQGFAPNTRTRLTLNAGSKNRSPGRDVHFAPDKTVSVLWALGPKAMREGIERAHFEAVRETLTAITRPYCGYVRAGKGGVETHEADIMAAMFQHGESREGDPQLHTHVTVFNFGRIREGERAGQFKAHCKPLLYEWKMTMGAVYRTALAWRLRTELGLPIERYGRDGELFRIPGVPDDLVKTFSTRRRQIVAAAAAEGYTTGQAPERAAGLNTATRRAKGEGTAADERRAGWLSKAHAQFGQGWRSVVAALGGQAGRPQETEIAAAKAGIAAVPAELARLEAAFGLKDVLRASAKSGTGVLTLKESLTLGKALVRSDAVVELSKMKYGWARIPDQAVRYTLPAHLYMEAEIVAMSERLVRRTGFAISSETVGAWLSAHRVKLSPEQRAAVGAAVEAPSGAAVIEGAAGAGKSFALRPAARIYVEQGYKVYATAVAWRMARQLGADCDVPAYALEKLLRGMALGKIAVDERTVVMVDEYSLLSVRQTHRLLRIINNAGAKVVFAGEAIQQQAVEAGVGPRLVGEVVGEPGSPLHAKIETMRRQQPDIEDYLAFEDMAKKPAFSNAKAASAFEKEVRKSALLRAQTMGRAERAFYRRVYDPDYTGPDKRRFSGTIWKIAASEMFRAGKPEETLAGLMEYAKRGKLHLMAGEEERLDTMVSDWARHREMTGDVGAIMLARTNAEVAELSLRARERVLPAFEERHEIVIRASRGGSARAAPRDLPLAVGDVARVGILMEGPGLFNGSLVRIAGLREDKDASGERRVHIRGFTPREDGEGEREVAFSTEDCRDRFQGDIRLDHGYARTMTSAQGMTEDRVFVLADEFLARTSAYPAFTRHRHDLDLYFNRKTLAELVRELLPEDRSDLALKDKDILEYLSTMLTRKGRPVTPETLKTAARQHFPDYEPDIEDKDILEYLGEMLSRDGSKVNALDFYDIENDDDRKARAALIAQARERVEARSRALGQFPEASWPRVARLEGRTGARPPLDTSVIDAAVEDLTRFSSRFDCVEAGSQLLRRRVAADALDDHLHALFRDPRVVPLHTGDTPKPWFSTVAVLGEERRLLESSDVIARRKRTSWNARLEKDVKRLATRRGLGAPARSFVTDVYGGSGLSLAALGGMGEDERRALLAALGDYGRANGERVIALGVSGGDCAALEAGLNAGGRTVRRASRVEGFLHGVGCGRTWAGPRHVAIVAGAERLDAGSMAALMEAARRRGFKLALIGDETGLPAPSRPGAFAALIARHGALRGDAGMGEPWRCADALARLEEDGRLHLHPERDATVAAAAAFDEAGHADRVVVATTTARECERINDAIQARRQEAGCLGAAVDLFVGVERGRSGSGIGRYFTPKEVAARYVGGRRIRVHEGDVIVLRGRVEGSVPVLATEPDGAAAAGGAAESGLDSGTRATVTEGLKPTIEATEPDGAAAASENPVSGDLQSGTRATVRKIEGLELTIETTVAGERRTAVIDAAQFRAFDLGYARALNTLAPGEAERALGVVSQHWEEAHLRALLRVSAHVEAHAHTAQTRYELESQLVTRTRTGFAGDAPTRFEARAARDRAQADPRWEELSEMERRLIETLDDRRKQAIEDAKAALAEIVERGAPDGFVNDNARAPETPEARAAAVARLSARARGAGPALARAFDEALTRHDELEAAAVRWAEADPARTVLDAPETAERMRVLGEMTRMLDVAGTDRGYYFRALGAAGITAGRREAARAAWRELRENEDARRARKTRVFADEVRDGICAYDSVYNACREWSRWTGRSLYDAPKAGAMLSLLEDLDQRAVEAAGDPGRYSAVLREQGVDEKVLASIDPVYREHMERRAEETQAFVDAFDDCIDTSAALHDACMTWAEETGRPLGQAPDAKKAFAEIEGLYERKRLADANPERYREALFHYGIDDDTLEAIERRRRQHLADKFAARFKRDLSFYTTSYESCRLWSQQSGRPLNKAPQAADMNMFAQDLRDRKALADADPGYSRKALIDYGVAPEALEALDRRTFADRFRKDAEFYNELYDLSQDWREKTGGALDDAPRAQEMTAAFKRLSTLKAAVDADPERYREALLEWGIGEGTLEGIERHRQSHFPPPREAAERTWLAVSFDEKEAAKAAGARWDAQAKCWYAPAEADMDGLRQWSRPATAQGAMDPREEFAAALRSVGCVVEGAHPIMDHQKHRIATEGDHGGKQSGFYVGHPDGHPSGYVKNHRTGAEVTWRAQTWTTDPAERARLRAEAARKRAEREAERARVYEETARKTAARIERLAAPPSPTPYLSAKGVDAHEGVYADGRTTVVPAMDANGKVWTAQSIFADGTKRFTKGGRKAGCFHAVGGLEAVEAAPAVVIAEGYATAASLAEALSCGTVAAFDAGNLIAVTKALQERFPDKTVIVAGDDDRATEKKRGVNPGREKAEAAAKAVDGIAVFPTFAPGDPADPERGLTDFNDLASTRGLGEVKRQIDAEVKRHMAAQRAQERDMSYGLSM